MECLAEVNENYKGMLENNKEVVLGVLRDKICQANSSRLNMADFCWHILQGIL